MIFRKEQNGVAFVKFALLSWCWVFSFFIEQEDVGTTVPYHQSNQSNPPEPCGTPVLN